MENRLKVARAEAKLSQSKLAAKVCVSRQTISKIENCKVVPNGALMLKISKAVGQPAENIFFTTCGNQEEQTG